MFNEKALETIVQNTSDEQKLLSIKDDFSHFEEMYNANVKTNLFRMVYKSVIWDDASVSERYSLLKKYSNEFFFTVPVSIRHLNSMVEGSDCPPVYEGTVSRKEPYISQMMESANDFVRKIVSLREDNGRRENPDCDAPENNVGIDQESLNTVIQTNQNNLHSLNLIFDSLCMIEQYHTAVFDEELYRYFNRLADIHDKNKEYGKMMLQRREEHYESMLLGLNYLNYLAANCGSKPVYNGIMIRSPYQHLLEDNVFSFLQDTLNFKNI